MNSKGFLSSFDPTGRRGGPRVGRGQPSIVVRARTKAGGRPHLGIGFLSHVLSFLYTQATPSGSTKETRPFLYENKPPSLPTNQPFLFLTEETLSASGPPPQLTPTSDPGLVKYYFAPACIRQVRN